MEALWLASNGCAKMHLKPGLKGLISRNFREIRFRDLTIKRNCFRLSQWPVKQWPEFTNLVLNTCRRRYRLCIAQSDVRITNTGELRSAVADWMILNELHSYNPSGDLITRNNLENGFWICRLIGPAWRSP